MLKFSRLNSAIALLALIGVISIWQINRFSYDWRLQNLQENSSNELLSTVSEIRQALEKYQYLPFLLTQNQDVRDLMIMPVAEISRDVSLYLEQTNLVAGSTSLFVLNREGRALAYSHWRDQQDFFERSHAQEPYFTQAGRAEQTRLFSMYKDGQSVFFMSAPIYGDGFMTGVAVVRIDLSLLEPKLPPNSRFDIRDNEDHLLLTHNVTQIPQQAEHWQPQLLKNDTEVELSTHESGAKLMRQSVQLDDLNWRVSVYSSIKPVLQFARLTSGISAGGFIVIGLLLLYLRERRHKQRIRQQSIDALAISEAEKKTIINKAQVGLLTVNADGNIVFINRMALRQFAVTEKLILNQPISKLLAGGDSFGPIRLALSRLNSKGFSPVTANEAVGVRADGSEFPILFSLRQLTDKPAPIYLATVIDITARKRLEYALREANESLEAKVAERSQALEMAQAELIQAEKLAALGRMSTAVVHELNQPLTAIRTYTAISRQILAQPEMLADNLQLIDDLTSRMEAITKQLKVFAYKKPQQLESVELTSAITRAAKLFKSRLEADQIDLQLPDESNAPIYIQGDQGRVEQVLTNLIRNACDAVCLHEDQRKIRIRLSTNADQVTLEIQDNGPGIEPDKRAQLFEPFFTTKPMGVGLGLGLSIVKSIVNDLDGEISADNQTDGGACFRIQLPCQNQP